MMALITVGSFVLHSCFCKSWSFEYIMPYINSVSASSERMHCHLLAQNMRELLRALSSVSISLLVFANGPQKGINFAVGWRRRWLHVVLQFIFIIIIVIKIRNTDAPHRRTAQTHRTDAPHRGLMSQLSIMYAVKQQNVRHIAERIVTEAFPQAHL